MSAPYLDSDFFNALQEEIAGKVAAASAIVTVVRVKRALLPRFAPAVIHDAARAHVQTRKLSRDELRLMGGDLIACFDAQLTRSGGWELLRRRSHAESHRAGIAAGGQERHG